MLSDKAAISHIVGFVIRGVSAWITAYFHDNGMLHFDLSFIVVIP